MKSYEDQNVDISSFKSATQIREKAEEDTTDMVLNTKDLNDKIRHMNEG